MDNQCLQIQCQMVCLKCQVNNQWVVLALQWVECLAVQCQQVQDKCHKDQECHQLQCRANLQWVVCHQQVVRDLVCPDKCLVKCPDRCLARCPDKCLVKCHQDPVCLDKILVKCPDKCLLDLEWVVCHLDPEWGHHQAVPCPVKCLLGPVCQDHQVKWVRHAPVWVEWADTHNRISYGFKSHFRL